MAATNRSIVYSTQVTHIGSGASLAAGAVSASTDVSTALASTNMGRYPLADIVLMIAPTASIASTSTNLFLYRRDLNIDGTSDENIPGTSNLNKLVGAFTAKASTTVSTTQFMQISDITLPGCDCEFYVENQLGVNVPAGWTLKVTPKTDSFA